MKADHIAVIDHERLYNDLMQLYQKNTPMGSFGNPAPLANQTGVKVFKLSKSGGVVTRPPVWRRKTRMTKYAYYYLIHLRNFIYLLLFII